ncbi:EF-P 5-aminopentanol modification-associated protein YfmH [Bacillus marinisedimentorum]|uniref:EF-P 5-aminopentanol modification-associated protein YfmH n=1 Tax=Bacillus marinisedimentorum TaxID=1821260 RepID=UPI0007DF713B|nr:pitrilysin family protein [Bacillus marinisedimentorum]
MERIEYTQLKEELFHEVLDNGLEVYILPKKDVNKTFATFTTRYGSIDNHFTPLGGKEPIKVPDGIAHFLEHKLFESEEGDVFQDFSKQGASANAFTSFTRTAYLFSSTSNVEKNLETLIDFVQDPYFTEESVDKEKGIIGQEIKMYEDNPDWRVYFGTIENLFAAHPVKIDIAGTAESISSITKDLLYTCYNTFYHPGNMLLFVAGAVNPAEVMKLIRSNQGKKTFAPPEPISRYFDDEPEKADQRERIIEMPVQTPKILFGVKTKKTGRSGTDLLRHELAIGLMLDYLFGKSSKNYEQLYNDGLIDDTFSFNYSEEGGFGFAVVGGDSTEPEKLSKKIEGYFRDFREDPLTDEALERTKKKKIGSFLRSLNSPEFIANQFTRYQFNGMNLFEVIPVLESLTAEDINQAANDFIDENCFTTCIVKAPN